MHTQAPPPARPQPGEPASRRTGRVVARRGGRAARQNDLICAAPSARGQVSFGVQERRLHARAARTNPLRGQRALEEIGSRTGTAASRDAVIGLEQGRISRSWQPDATTSRWRPWPNPGFRMSRLVQHEWEQTGMHVRHLWAKHPEIPSGSVHHVQAVSSRVTPSPPSRCRAARRAVAATRFTTEPKRKRPSPE